MDNYCDFAAWRVLTYFLLGFGLIASAARWCGCAATADSVLVLWWRFCSTLQAVMSLFWAAVRCFVPLHWWTVFSRMAAGRLDLLLQKCCTEWEIARAQLSPRWTWLSRPYDWCLWCFLLLTLPTLPPASLPVRRVNVARNHGNNWSCYLLLWACGFQA